MAGEAPLYEKNGNRMAFCMNFPTKYYDVIGLCWKIWHRSNKRNDSAFSDLKNFLRNVCTRSCCHTQIKINDCKKHADIIAHNINQLWLRNWGKGPYQDKSIFGKDWDPVGGYLCWDWAEAFFAVGKTHGGENWCSSVGTAKPLVSSLAIHYFTWLCACDCYEDDCCVVIDDGYLDEEYIHTNEEVDFFDNDEWEIVDYVDVDVDRLKPMKENNGYFDSEYTLTDED